MLTAIVLGFQKYKFLSSAIEVQGQITGFQKSPDPDDDYATPIFEFEYQEQKKKIINPFMVNDAMYHVKQAVPIIFNSADLDEAQMKTKAFQYYPTALFIALAGLLAIIHSLVFLPTYKTKNPQPS